MFPFSAAKGTRGSASVLQLSLAIEIAKKHSAGEGNRLLADKIANSRRGMC